VLSQVVLSFGIPFALVPLVALTTRRDLMGDAANRPWTTVLAAVAAGLLIVLNVTLLVLLAAGAGPAGVPSTWSVGLRVRRARRQRRFAM
jgi:manganese transport protein